MLATVNVLGAQRKTDAKYRGVGDGPIATVGVASIENRPVPGRDGN
jgi:hypothetical protein